jgi:hypothetical protein
MARTHRRDHATGQQCKSHRYHQLDYRFHGTFSLANYPILGRTTGTGPGRMTGLTILNKGDAGSRAQG